MHRKRGGNAEERQQERLEQLRATWQELGFASMPSSDGEGSKQEADHQAAFEEALAHLAGQALLHTPNPNSAYSYISFYKDQ